MNLRLTSVVCKDLLAVGPAIVSSLLSSLLAEHDGVELILDFLGDFRTSNRLRRIDLGGILADHVDVIVNLLVVGVSLCNKELR